MPAQKKPAERRQRGGRTPDVGTVSALPVRTAAGLAPSADLTWPDDVQAEWVEFWSSPLANPSVLKPTDVPALRRLFDLRARLVDAQRRFNEAPVAEGSMGQPVMSPWAQEIHRLESAISKLEDKFGLTPMARLRLGVTFEEGVSLASRNQALLQQLGQR